jgi:hypothetical protein
MRTGKTKKTWRMYETIMKPKNETEPGLAGREARRTHTFTVASQKVTLQSSTALTVADLAHSLQTKTGA